MNIFNQIVPRLSRSNGRSTELVDEGQADGGFTVKPLFEIEETPEAWRLTVQLPGVTKEDLDFTAENEQIVITGRRTWKLPAGQEGRELSTWAISRLVPAPFSSGVTTIVVVSGLIPAAGVTQ